MDRINSREINFPTQTNSPDNEARKKQLLHFPKFKVRSAILKKKISSGDSSLIKKKIVAQNS